MDVSGIHFGKTLENLLRKSLINGKLDQSDQLVGLPSEPGRPPKPGSPLSPFGPFKPGRPGPPGKPGEPFGPDRQRKIKKHISYLDRMVMPGYALIFV